MVVKVDGAVERGPGAVIFGVNYIGPYILCVIF